MSRTRLRRVAAPQKASFRVGCAVREMVSAQINVMEVYTNHSSSVPRERARELMRAGKGGESTNAKSQHEQNQ